MKTITTCPEVAPVPSERDLLKDRYFTVKPHWVKARLKELGFEWTPQVHLYLRYPPGKATFEILAAIAVVGSPRKAKAYRLR